MLASMPKAALNPAAEPHRKTVEPETALLHIQDYSAGIEVDKRLVTIVEHVNLSISPGEFLGLAGESGSGKSFLCRSLVGLNGPTGWVTGKIQFEGSPISLSSRDGSDGRNALRGNTVGFIFQQPSEKLNPIMTIGAHLSEVLRRHTRLVSAEIKRRSIELLTEVGLPNPDRRLKWYPHQLSGGQNQRVMIALALAANPALLVADEPTTGLDVVIQAQIMDLLKSLSRSRGMAVMLVSHDLDVLARVCDRIAVFYAGRLVEVGPSMTIFGQPLHPYSHALLETRPSIKSRKSLKPIPGDVPSPGDRPSGCAFEKRCARATERCRNAGPTVRQVGNVEFACHHPIDSTATSERPARAHSTTAITKEFRHDEIAYLRLQSVSKSFAETPSFWSRRRQTTEVVSNISLELRSGRVLGIVGQSGSGKSTLANMIVGALKPSSGKIEIASAAGTSSISPLGIQLIQQDPAGSLDPRLRAFEHVAEPLIANKMYGADERIERARASLMTLGLTAQQMDARPAELSGGQLQRIVIARALILEPKFVVCDEPTSALDVSVQAQVVNLLISHCLSRGVGLVFISHNLALVRSLADDVGVMFCGELVEYGSADAVYTAPQHAHTRELMAIGLHNETPVAAAASDRSAGRGFA